MNQLLASELISMSKADKAMRTKAQKDHNLWDENVDKANNKRLKEIVAEFGWPTISKAGEQASYAAWLLVQHAYADLDFMKHCLELMRQAPNDVQPAHPAYLEDRILTMEDKPQIYGTQFRNLGHGFEPFPIVDPEHVNERRASAGIQETIEQAAERIRRTHS